MRKSSVCHPCAMHVSCMHHPCAMHVSSVCHPCHPCCHACIVRVSFVCHPCIIRVSCMYHARIIRVPCMHVSSLYHPCVMHALSVHQPCVVRVSSETLCSTTLQTFNASVSMFNTRSGVSFSFRTHLPLFSFFAALSLLHNYRLHLSLSSSVRALVWLGSQLVRTPRLHAV